MSEEIDYIRWKAIGMAIVWTKQFRKWGQEVDNKRRKEFEKSIDFCLRLEHKSR